MGHLHGAANGQQVCLTLRMVLMMKRSSWDRKKTLPDLPGDGSSRSAWSPE